MTNRPVMSISAGQVILLRSHSSFAAHHRVNGHASSMGHVNTLWFMLSMCPHSEHWLLFSYLGILYYPRFSVPRGGAFFKGGGPTNRRGRWAPEVSHEVVGMHRGTGNAFTHCRCGHGTPPIPHPSLGSLLLVVVDCLFVDNGKLKLRWLVASSQTGFQLHCLGVPLQVFIMRLSMKDKFAHIRIFLRLVRIFFF